MVARTLRVDIVLLFRMLHSFRSLGVGCCCHSVTMKINVKIFYIYTRIMPAVIYNELSTGVCVFVCARSGAKQKRGGRATALALILAGSQRQVKRAAIQVGCTLSSC